MIARRRNGKGQYPMLYQVIERFVPRYVGLNRHVCAKTFFGIAKREPRAWIAVGAHSVVPGRPIVSLVTESGLVAACYGLGWEDMQAAWKEQDLNLEVRVQE